MYVFVVLTRYYDSMQFEAVFSSIEEAKQYLQKRGDEGNPYFLKEFVDVEESNDLFVATWLDRSIDIYCYEGIYGTFKKAEAAYQHRGKGLVESHKIDSHVA